MSNPPGSEGKKRYRRHELDEEEENLFKMVSSGDEGCVFSSCSVVFALQRQIGSTLH